MFLSKYKNVCMHVKTLSDVRAGKQTAHEAVSHLVELFPEIADHILLSIPTLQLSTYDLAAKVELAKFFTVSVNKMQTFKDNIFKLSALVLTKKKKLK